MKRVRTAAPIVACLALLCVAPAHAQQANMTFFLTSAGPGKGADLGGLAGADRHCQQLAASVGAGGKTWRAYLSTQGAGATNARDRIGKGPWVNAKGLTVAKHVAELHGTINLPSRWRCRKKAKSSTAGATAQPPRRPHGLATGRHGFRRRSGSYLQELDEQHARLGHGRPFRPHWRERRPSSKVLEFVTPLAGPGRGLLPGRLAQHGRRWVVLLLCGQLNRRPKTRHSDAGESWIFRGSPAFPASLGESSVVSNDGGRRFWRFPAAKVGGPSVARRREAGQKHAGNLERPASRRGCVTLLRRAGSIVARAHAHRARSFLLRARVMHFLETYLAAILYVSLPFGIVTSPGSTVLFTGKLMMLLLLYIREDAVVVRQPIYGLLFGNVLLFALAWVMRQHTLTALAPGRAADFAFLNEIGALMVWGTAILFFDCNHSALRALAQLVPRQGFSAAGLVWRGGAHF